MNIPQDIKFTNHDIARIIPSSLDQVRRWALISFPADATTEWGKGKQRKYDIDETFKIFMSVLLSIESGMSLSKLIEHINNLWSHLNEHNALPLQILSEEELSEDIIENRKFSVIEQICIHPGPVYDFRSIIDYEEGSSDISKQTYFIKYKIIRLRP